MLYINKVYNNSEGNWYMIYDASTESSKTYNENKTKEIITNVGIKNAKVVDNNIILPEWVYKTEPKMNRKTSNDSIILIGMILEDKFKIVSVRTGSAIVNRAELRTLILANKIENCWYIKKKDRVDYMSADTLNILGSEEFNRNIDNQYKAFIAKSKLMGMDMSFNYKIEGDIVRLCKYTGSSKKVLIPGFVTSIEYDAFYDMEITQITLNEGLKYIGESAFRANRLSHVDMPNSLELYWDGAFDGNTQLRENGGVQVGKNTKIVRRAL